MNSILRAAALSIVVAVSGSMVAAQDWDKGKAAYQAGDYATALEEWRALAEKGAAAAQYLVGTMYDFGRGVPEDDAEAVRWYRLAAEQGDAYAQYLVGGMHEDGKGVLKDLTTAHMWYNISSANGDDDAAINRDKLEEQMTREQIAEATRRAKICMSSDYEDCD